MICTFRWLRLRRPGGRNFWSDGLIEPTDQGDDDARQRVVAALEELGVHLLEHLDYEELQAGPSIRRLDRLHGR